MRNLKCVFMLSLVLMFIAGCEKMEVQPDPLNAADDISLKSAEDAQFKGSKKHCVPFKGEFEVHVQNVLAPGPPPPKIFETWGFGKATHLGKAKVVLIQEWFPPGPPPLNFPWTGTGNGEIEFTAANGDILLAYYSNAEAVHESPTLVNVTLTGIFKDGGTGRFEHAEGEFLWSVVFNPVKNLGSVTATGKIMYSK